MSDYVWPPDPYTIIHGALWDLLESDSAFTDGIPSANRRKLLGPDRSPLRQESTTVDLPEVRIIPIASSFDVNASSCGSRDRVTWEIQVSSGDQRVNAAHFPLKWVIFQAMQRARLYLANAAEAQTDIPSLQVVNVRPSAVREGLNQDPGQPGITGWAGLYALEVEFWVETQTIAE